MANENLVLYVATYDDDQSATDDFGALKAARDSDEIAVRAAVIAKRDMDGKVTVTEHDPPRAERDIGVGTVGGLVVGLFSPPLLASTAIGAAIGGVVYEIGKLRDEHEIKNDVETYLPNGSSAIMAVIDDEYADRLDRVLAKSTRRISRAVDSGDYDKLAKALDKSADSLQDAANS
ncbi:MAG: DUF1269 domain-containing protein [Acidimicrobiia bacterium]|jgi:uncharacterized membrane protein|nr:DUF1269 domain-containing protein [Acidimicrobiia bacterium]